VGVRRYGVGGWDPLLCGDLSSSLFEDVVLVVEDGFDVTLSRVAVDSSDMDRVSALAGGLAKTGVSALR
jgi:hypothetical protein